MIQHRMNKKGLFMCGKAGDFESQVVVLPEEFKHIRPQIKLRDMGACSWVEFKYKGKTYSGIVFLK